MEIAIEELERAQRQADHEHRIAQEDLTEIEEQVESIRHRLRSALERSTSIGNALYHLRALPPEKRGDE